MSTSELSPVSLSLRLCALGFAAVLVASAGRLLVAIQPLEPPGFGPRGKARAHARKSALFRLLEPLLLKLAGALRLAIGGPLRGEVAALLRVAGEPLGFQVEELFALSLLTCCTCAALASWLVSAADMHAGYTVYVTVLGLLLPVLRVRGLSRSRARELERSLPFAIDLCVLCMGAGSDFPAALRGAVELLGAAHAACRADLSRVLDELALGATRAVALRGFAERTTSVAVREFVAAVCQSEEKGTPLVATLTIQAACLRQRRSVKAEELAAQAGVKMMLPMLLLVVTLMLIIFGPFIVNGAGL